MDAFARLGEAAAWWDALRRLTGDGFYAGVALLVLVLLIVGAWRAPQLQWFTGKRALWVVIVLVSLLIAMVVIEIIRRETSLEHLPAAPRRTPASPSGRSAPPTVPYEIGG